MRWRSWGPALLAVCLCAPALSVTASAAASPPLNCPSPGQPAPPANRALSTPASSGTKPAAPPTPTPDVAALCARQAQIEATRLQLNSNVTVAMAVQERLTRSLEENARQQAVIQARIVEVRGELKALDDQIERLTAAEVLTEAGIQRDRAEAGSLARSIYRTPDSLLLAALKAHSLGQLISISADLLATGVRVQRSQRQLIADLHRLEAERAAAVAARTAKRDLEQELAKQSDKVAQLQREQEESTRLLAGQIARTRAELDRLARQSGELARQITAALEAEQNVILAAAMQQAWAQAMLWEASPGHPSVGISAHHSKAFRFIWPEPSGVVSQRFGPTELALAPPYGPYPHFHTGIDIADAAGTSVLAADDGVVAVVGHGTTGYGNFVVLAHRDSMMTLYGHLQATLVEPGDMVTQRQPIGLEGSSGNSTGPHVHFELRIRDEPNDPAPYLPPGAPSTSGMDGT